MTAASITPWKVCQACGHWQRAPDGSACSVCQWPRLAAGNPSSGPPELRVLVDVELRSDHTWHITGITTPRLADAINQPMVLQRLNDEGLRVLLNDFTPGAGWFPSLRSWEQLRDLARTLLTDEVNSVIRRSWEGLRQPSPARVIVSIRMMLLDPDVSPGQVQTPPWLEFVPFDAAAASAAAKLRPGDVTFDVAGAHVSFAPGGNRIEVAVQYTAEMLVETCEIIAGDKLLLRAPLTRVVRRGTRTALPPITLSADAVRGFAASGGAPGLLLLSVRGNDNRFGTPLPSARLPSFTSVADIFLDLGSTSTKWALCLDERPPVVSNEETASLTEAWGIEGYRKGELISDATGQRWSEWVARALPALRFWVGREYSAYLRHVHLSLPATAHFDVTRLASALRDAASSATMDQNPRELVRSASRDNLVASGGVVLVPEHELLASHYLGVLGIIQKAARDYAARFASHEERRRDQEQRRARWQQERAEADAYNASITWYTFWKWGTQKAGPTGPRPEVAERIIDPAAWMDDLVTHPEQFDRVVLLDAGGLSLDMSVLEQHELVLALSHSATTCGGEALSSRIGRKASGGRGTRYKAQLGLRWLQAPDLTDSDQREYRDVTRDLYGPVLAPLFQSLGERWKRSSYCSVLLTGGGSRNPHLGEFVRELAESTSLHAYVVDAPAVQLLIQQARDFPEPLAELDSGEIQRFEATQHWSERHEHHAFARYDKFAVVGGMCARGGVRL